MATTDKKENDRTAVAVRLNDLLNANFEKYPYIPDDWLVSIPKEFGKPIIFYDGKRNVFMKVEQPLFTTTDEPLVDDIKCNSLIDEFRFKIFCKVPITFDIAQISV